MMGNIDKNHINVGVIGLGLMGTSFIVTLLLSGHKVIAIAPQPQDLDYAPERIKSHLLLCAKAGLLNKPVENYLSDLVISEDYELLHSAHLVLECLIERLEIKKLIYKKIESIVSNHTVIASNTSAIPISVLQKYLLIPGRFLGIHWAEPSYLTRFMEITCGKNTDFKYAEWVYEIAHSWGKEPTLLRKDLRGFVTNRLMYAVYREGLHMVSNGEASLTDVDKAFRYDAGSWITLMGIFQRMDYTGLKDYAEIFRTLFPKLCNDDNVPPLMQQMVDKNAKGIQNLSGLYHYTEEEAQKWQEAFAVFNMEIYQLATKYSFKREKVKTVGSKAPITEDDF
jgi:3-hydroxybutyryl-CoA dehydrogenase